MAYLRNTNFEPLGSDVYGLPKSASLEISCLLVQARYAIDGESPIDQTEDMCVYARMDGYLPPLGSSKLAVILEPCANIMPTCFIVPLLQVHGKTQTSGLVVQEATRSDSSVEMRDFVRIGSFGKSYCSGADEVIHALLKNLPAEGDEFEQRLRDSAQAWKEAKSTDPWNRVKGTAKAEWATIRLV